MNNLYSRSILLYTKVFAKEIFSRWNSYLIMVGLHGLGFDNYQNEDLSGEKYVLDRFIKGIKKPIIIDVGAHIGDSAILIKSINKTAEIHSFEPNPNTYKILVKNSKKYRFFAYHTALGENKATLAMYDTSVGGSSAFTSIYKNVVESEHHEKSKEFKVKVITLDDFYNKLLKGKNIDLLKIDVEGFEMSVFKGAKKLIASGNVRLIQFEFNIMNRHSRTFFLDFEKFLKNYTLYRLLPNGLIRISSDSILFSEIFLYQNILAIQKK